MKEKTQLESSMELITKFTSELDDLAELVEMAEEENDESEVEEAKQSLEGLLSRITGKEIECLFSGEADGNDCFIEIHAGAGGTESHDWAEMLLRMYTRWCDKKGFKKEVVGILAGEEAGIKSATIKIRGHNAYGWARTESGVHRLVRISPFNAAGKRQTSFASVWVFPVIDDNINIEINEADLKIDTYRASGAGGQHVNTTDSAVRITHAPTGIVVQCQNDRSQHRNKAEAISMLKSRLYEAELQKRRDKADATHASKTEIGWGHQIRSYVLQPYQMVKDLRTGFETSDTQGILDGDLDKMISKTLEYYAVK
jgi:peptide chain release factor 2